jgi:hypothetical protein
MERIAVFEQCIHLLVLARGLMCGRLRLGTKKGTQPHVIRGLRYFGQKPAVSPCLFGEGNVNGRALAGGGVGPHTAAVAFDDSFADGEAETGAGIFVLM